MKIHLRWICSFVLISSVGFAFTLKTYTPDWDSLDTRPIPSWYDEAKIGIFIHWGLYSVPSFGSEWLWWYWKGNQPDPQVVDYMTKNYPPDWTYADFGPYFHAEFYNPNQWADLFVASGAKYVVLTSKHHEGYAMWPSKYSFNWNSMDLGPKKDLIGELALALRNRTDIAFGLYHSLYEWFHPLYLQDKKNNFTTDHFTQMKALPELKELIERYQPDVIWSDGDWEATDTYWHSTEFLSWLYNESPVKDKIVVNDRWGPGAWCRHGDFYSCNDRFNPGYLLPHKWENCFTIDKNSWAYRRTSQLHDYLTIEEILHQIIVTVSTGGNALINIGPAGDGTIPTIFEERLRQMGAWLNIHGEAIYQSIPWNYQNDTIHPDVWYTSSKNKQSLYACLLVWPTNTTELVLGAPIPSSNTVVSLLGSSMDPLKWRQMNETTGMIIDLSTVNSFTLASHGAWVFKLQYLKNH